MYEEPWYRFQRVVEAIEAVTSIDRDSDWLDAGCQIGQFIEFVKSRHRITAYGIDDYAPEDMAVIGQKYCGLAPDTAAKLTSVSWTYLQRRIDETGFAVDEVFDFISALEIIEHMVDTDAFIEDCFNHLKPQGHLVISTPNINSLRNRISVPVGIYPAGLEYKNIIHHVRLYNQTKLVDHVCSHGFELKHARGVNFLPARFLSNGFVRNVDKHLADTISPLCGNIIGVFKKGR
jgi:2-polyprenyl-3-methyl-5-hydroxy-6-metoxy-1,4-benzoquinol methylase